MLSRKRIVALAVVVAAGAAAAPAQAAMVTVTNNGIAGQQLTNTGFGGVQLQGGPIGTPKRFLTEQGGFAGNPLVIRSVSDQNRCLRAGNNLVALITCPKNYELVPSNMKWTFSGGKLKPVSNPSKLLTAVPQTSFFSSLAMRADNGTPHQRWAMPLAF